MEDYYGVTRSAPTLSRGLAVGMLLALAGTTGSAAEPAAGLPDKPASHHSWSAPLPRGTSGGIPLQLNHQGVVHVEGVRFEGNGDFRFALVDPDTGVNLWTNDGSAVPGPGTPTEPVNLPVINGIYNVRLGDEVLPNMTAIPSTVFNDDNVALRIWFDDGISGIEQLAPDHVLTSTPYAYRSALADAAEGLNIPGESTAAVTVDAAGKVGIGTPTPETLLDVDGELTANAIDGTFVATDFYSGHVRLGRIQIVWGKYNSSASGDAVSTTLFFPFIDELYSLVLTPTNSTQPLFATVVSKSTNSFVAQTYQADVTPPARSVVGGDYMAAGKWR